MQIEEEKFQVICLIDIYYFIITFNCIIDYTLKIKMN